MENHRPNDPSRNRGLPAQVVSQASLLERLAQGHTLVTGNSRLARVLAQRYDHWRMERGDRQWASPDILPWGAWLERHWERAALKGLPGTGFAVPGGGQLLSLWETALRRDPDARALFRPESLASQLMETRRLAVEWELDFDHPAWRSGDNENHAAFHRWNLVFEAQCEAGRWISPEDRTACLARAVAGGLLRMGGPVDLLGFDEFDPARLALLGALDDTGHAVCHLALEPRTGRAVRWQATDGRSELEAMARWVRHWFETEPECTIAVVVPELQSRRDEVERALETVMTPGDGYATKPWNISMGTPLDRVPMVEAAFDLLGLLEYRIGIQAVGRVLRSPWLRGATAERNSRALLEKRLREQYPGQLTRGEIAYRALEPPRDRGGEAGDRPDEPRAWNSPELAGCLDILTRFARDNGGGRPASEWAARFDRLLAALGWPLADEANHPAAGKGPEHDRNWQALQAWRDALRELASLDATLPPMRRGAAVARLRRLCRARIFQPRTPPARVQVLGLYEASGLQFDHLWVLGLHNGNWPPPARPNPFIPARLQKEAGLPHSSPGRELAIARTVTERLLETSPDCVFSYPGRADDEDVLPSPLLEGEAIHPTGAVPGWPGNTWRSLVARATGPDTGPLAGPGPLRHPTARGGSSILKNQALCPFRAFAANRLGAEPLETPADGISAALHGSLVHQVLEAFWRETLSLGALLALDEPALDARVRAHVTAIVEEERALSRRPAFRAVEADRVHRHVTAYLELEKGREDFVVTGHEKAVTATLGGQEIRLVIDRVDRLASGGEVVIDYKTGRVDPRKWFGERPEDPQMPLYAVNAAEPPAAVVFGVIRDDETVFKGVARREGLLPGIPPKRTVHTEALVEAGEDMAATVESWRAVLHGLMAGFLAGEAGIEPKNGPSTCTGTYCGLQSLCRIGELEQAETGDAA